MSDAHERKVLLTWVLLVVLSIVSYVLIDGRGSVLLLFGVVFIKLERIWGVYLELGRGPRWLHRAVLGATLLLMTILALTVR